MATTRSLSLSLSVSSKPKILHTLFYFRLKPKPQNIHPFSSRASQLSLVPDPSSPHLVNEISRILSDHRNPHNDLELSLNTFSNQISTNMVEQVLKRCKNLGFSAHRFFLWAKRIPGFEHSVISYQILVDILGSSKQFAILWDFLIEMRDSHCVGISSEVFWLVFRAYGRANLPEDAVRAFNRMVEFGIKPGIHDLNQLLYVLCKRKHVRHAQQFFDKVKIGFELNAKTYSILMRGWGDIGDSNEARKLFDEMLERGCKVDVLAYTSLLEALCKAGNVDEAYKIFREMGSNGVDADASTYSIFIRAYCEANDMHSAFRVLDRMRRYELLPNVYTYNCIIKKLCKNDRVDEAYQLLDEMIERGVWPDTWSYNAMQAYHCDHSEVNRALKLISRMEKDNCMPDRHTYNMVLKLLIRIGRFDRATEVWESMGERRFYPSVSTYAVMIHGLCKKKGKLEEACKYFEMMVDEGIPPYTSTIELLRNRILELGFLDQIEILANKMERSTSCSIQELANMIRGDETNKTSRSEETDLESD
ncbi:pentatricopeptide repeat-containing protein At1g52640, mitochondrial [Quercus robur]|uniref:pentatricopeptide repeat-containing protein At1g52640, mitochondrial n=1 Tax=Quercus robur TaxID=38942 RepID=UPI0021633E73|nr:pentatricopeptide repeat-containing protein At1g52640, mitochondrial [Quercus robur]